MATQSEKKFFWTLFEEILIENGEPFKICYQKSNGEITSYANVNKKQVPNNTTLDLSFLPTRNKLRINLYIHKGVESLAGRRIVSNKDYVQSMVSKPIRWEYGTKNAKTLRPSVYIDLNGNYRAAIENSLPIIMQFVSVAKKFAENEFFDF